MQKRTNGPFFVKKAIFNTFYFPKAFKKRRLHITRLLGLCFNFYLPNSQNSYFNMYFLGIDLGSSSVKVALVAAESRQIVKLVSYPATEMSIHAKQEGWAEQDPEMWWAYLKQACQMLLAQSGAAPEQISAIGIAYQMHGLVIVDKNQEVLRPAIIWCDSRAVDIGATADEALGHKKCLQSMLNSPGNFTASKLRWVKENEPELFGKIHKAMLPGDYLAMKMTGDISTTISGLSEGILWDFAKEDVAHDLLKYYGIRHDQLPEIVDTFAIQGRLTEVAAAALGLALDTPVSYRAGDQPNNALSLGVIHPNQVAGTGGTSGVIYGVVSSPKYDLLSRVNSFAHVNYSRQAARIGVLLCINGAGSQYAWIKNQIAENDLSYEDIESAQKKIPVGSNGLRILPFGNGAERMLQNKYQGAQMFNLQLNMHTRAHMYRAALEGIAFAYVYGMEIMKDMGIQPDKMRVGNDNLFQSEIFSQTIATLTGVDIDMVETTGAAGAAKAAGFGVGYYPSLDAAIGDLQIIKSYRKEDQLEAYQKAYQDWRSILQRQYAL